MKSINYLQHWDATIWETGVRVSHFLDDSSCNTLMKVTLGRFFGFTFEMKKSQIGLDRCA